MPTVLIDLRYPGPDGVDVPASGGATRWTPTRRRHVHGVEDYVVLPAEFDGPAVGEVVVAATGPDWCWHVTEGTRRGISRYVAVPDVPGPIAYADLVDVDPATLEPSPPALAGWEAVLGQVIEGATTATTSATRATQAAAYADEAERGATDAATAAGLSADTAVQAAIDAHLTIDHDPGVGWIITQGGLHG